MANLWMGVRTSATRNVRVFQCGVVGPDLPIQESLCKYHPAGRVTETDRQVRSDGKKPAWHHAMTALPVAAALTPESRRGPHLLSAVPHAR